MKKTLLLVLAVCMIAVMVPAACYAVSEGEEGPEAVLEEAQAPEEAQESEEPFFYENKMRLSDDEQADGWYQDPTTKKWMYYYGGVPFKGKQPIGGSYYFFDNNGFLKTGWQDLPDGNRNYYDPTPGTPGGPGSTYGCMVTGWKTISKKKYYFGYPLGEMFKGMHKIKNSTYIFNSSNGAMLTGWIPYKSNKYYGDTKSGQLKTGWLKLSKKKYFLDRTNFKLRKGWLNDKDNKYYLDPKTGVLQTGWKTISKKKYYLNPSNGKVTIGFKTIKKKKYYFNSNGVMLTGGPHTIKGYKYIFTSKGVMRTGVVKLSGKLYYFFSSGKGVKNRGWFRGSDKKQRYSLGGGRIATGNLKIGNLVYVFNSSTGVLIRSMDVDDQAVQKYSSSTKYLIKVIKNKHLVRIYKGKKNNWVRQYNFTCSIGRPGYETPSGTFTIKSKKVKHERKDPDTGVKVRCWGLCKFTDDLAFNSIIYDAATGKVYDSRLGTNVSFGSVRLSYNNAMWIYYNIPVKTKVVIA